MYKIIAIVSLCVRQFCLENPFEYFGVWAEGYNAIAGAVMGPVTYGMVGLVYNSGDCPALGGFLFLIFYWFLNEALCLMGQFKFAWWAVVVVTLGCGVVVWGICRLKEFLFDGW